MMGKLECHLCVCVYAEQQWSIKISELNQAIEPFFILNTCEHFEGKSCRDRRKQLQ